MAVQAAGEIRAWLIASAREGLVRITVRKFREMPL
jgi:hypothetical protein